MGFFVTTLLFFAVGFVASVALPFLYNKGPSENLLHVTLVITAVVCCWLLWAIVYLAQLKPLINPILKAAGE
ncbi:hypothetical protein O6H91_05G085800 [Diphasiastrum complanatum]|uniref:Uncharacterized protein n=1 Tax=Diphasiastrum complanatum TaxID=34168 RepID=A0ACC2DQL1_DIPCM|nr:hypothetical protein O6H91_05G085800 [Diphasiastrum complanatum]